MIRFVFALRRKSGMSVADFQEHLVRKYGPLVAGYGDVLGIRRYVQSLTLEGDPKNAEWIEAHGGDMEPSYDAINEVWWDSLEKLGESMSSAPGREAWAALVAEEAEFIDHANSPLWLAYEYPQVNVLPEDILARPLSNLVKFVFTLRHPTSMSLQEAQHYWLTVHGPVWRNCIAGIGIGVSPSNLRYFQVHRFDHELADQLREARGTQAEPYTGVAEIWWPRAPVGESHAEDATRGRLIMEDERKFIDIKRSAVQLTKERQFIDHVLCEI